MLEISFRGEVFPRSENVSLPLATAKWEDHSINLEVEFSINITDSRIEIKCLVNQYDYEIKEDIYIRAYDSTRALIDLLGFVRGSGLAISLDGFTDPDGVESPIILRDSYLQSLSTSIRSDEDYVQMISYLGNIDLAFALRDLIEAITIPHVSVTRVGRVIDSVKHNISPNLNDEKHAWRAMRDALNLTEPYLKYITDLSKAARHARPGHTPGTVTTELTRRGWIIMDRFLHFLKRSRSPLPISEFPML